LAVRKTGWARVSCRLSHTLSTVCFQPMRVPSSASSRLPAAFAFARYTAVGAIGSAAHFAVLIALVQAAAVRPVPASAAGMVVGAFINYHLNRRFTFRSTRRHREAMWRFFAIAALLLAVN